METKLFEIRDAGTFIPVLAVRLSPGSESERYLLGRSGYGIRPEDQARYIQVSKIYGGTGQSSCDPYDWGSCTMLVAHQHILENWARLETGAVVDVEFILGESATQKQSERTSEAEAR